MSETVLFTIGVLVFGLTIIGAMMYGRYAFNNYYVAQLEADGVPRAGTDPSQ